MMKITDLAACGLLASGLLVSVAQAAPATEPALRDYRAVALSANGQHIAAIESSKAAEQPQPQRPHAVIVVRDAANGAIVQQFDPCSVCSYDKPSWSPDGRQLAFVGYDAKAGTAQLYLATLSQSPVRVLTSIKGVAGTARWSPDGKQLALLATVGARKLAGAVEAGVRQVGEVGSEDDAQRIAVVAANRVCCHQATPMCMNTAGRPMAAALSPPARKAMATAIGGSPSSAISMRPRASCAWWPPLPCS